MDVRDAAGQVIGVVLAVGATAFVVARPGRPDVSLPYSVVQAVSADGVVLTLTAVEIDTRAAADDAGPLTP